MLRRLIHRGPVASSVAVLVGGLVACGGSRAPTAEGSAAPAQHVELTSSARPTLADSAEVPARPLGGTVIDKVVLGNTTVSGRKIAIDSDGNRYITGSFQGRAVFGDLPPIVSDSGSEAAFVLKVDATNNPLWVKSFGSAQHSDAGFEIALDTDGNLFTSGFFSGTMDMGSTSLTARGASSVYLAKLDPAGRVLWANVYGDTHEQVAMRLRPYPGGGVVASGAFSGTMSFGGPPTVSPWDEAVFVARIDASGKGRWGRAFGHRLDLVETDTAVDADGNIFLSTGSDGTPDFVKGGSPSATNDLGPVLVKLEPDGKAVRARRFGKGANEASTAIAIDTKGNLRYAVASNGVTSFDGVERKPRAGDVLVVANFDASGALLWRREILSSSFLWVGDATMDAAGDFYIAGYFAVPPSPGITARNDGFVVKINPAGEVEWTLKVVDGDLAELSGIAIDPSGKPVAVGSAVGAASGPNDRLWIGRIAP